MEVLTRQTGGGIVPPHPDEDDDGPEIVAPTFKEMFSAAMFTAPSTELSNSSNSSVLGKSDVPGKSGKKKKKGNKGTLLFATGGQRKY